MGECTHSSKSSTLSSVLFLSDPMTYDDAKRAIAAVPRAVEGKIRVPGGEVWYRRMGHGGVPLLLIHGGPGFPSDILFEAFEPLTRDREVIWYDQLGVGRSDPIHDASQLTVERFLDELAAVIDGLGLDARTFMATTGAQCSACNSPRSADPIGGALSAPAGSRVCPARARKSVS